VKKNRGGESESDAVHIVWSNKYSDHEGYKVAQIAKLALGHVRDTTDAVQIVN